MQDISSSTSNSIVLMVRLNSDCAGNSQLRIRATVNDNTNVVLSRETNFANSITLGPVLPAQYTCIIFIVNGTQIIENMSIPCRTNLGMLALATAVYSTVY